jgi:hypothetical protein
VRLAEPSLRAKLEPALDALAHGEDPPDAEVVKRTRLRDVLRIALPDGDAAYVKRDRAARAFWRRAGAEREYANLLRLRAAGFAAVEPLAVAERRAGGTDEWLLVTRAAPGAVPLADALRAAEPARARALRADAAALARRLHEARLWHRDLHVRNLLLQGDALVLVDVQKLRALPFALPPALRARDLVWLVSDGRLADAAPARDVAEAYARALPGVPDPERFARLLARATAQARRTRLRSRARRCVGASTGFRSERRGALGVLRRADVTTSAALAAASAAGPGEATRLAELVGGPPPGPAPDPFGRGQGAPEPGAPARAPACARRFGRGLGLREPLALAHPGLRAWRLAHALLLREVETPAPLALVETRRLGFVSHSVLLTRCADDTLDLAVALAGAPGRARDAGAALARWHARGVEAAALGLRYAVETQRLVATRPESARFHDPFAPADAERDLAAVAARLGPGEREALLAGYASVRAAS